MKPVKLAQLCTSFLQTNKVNEHNLKELLITCPQYNEIHAQELVNSKETGKLELLSGHHAKAYDTCLAEVLHVGIDVRVMVWLTGYVAL